MDIHLDPAVLELLFKGGSSGLIIKSSYYNSGYVYSILLDVINEFKRVRIISNAEISPDFPFLDVTGINAQNDVGISLKLPQEQHLDIRVKPGQDPGGMIIK